MDIDTLLFIVFGWIGVVLLLILLIMTSKQLIELRQLDAKMLLQLVDLRKQLNEMLITRLLTIRESQLLE
jgi:hypothetical protein